MKNPEFRWLRMDAHTLAVHYCLCLDVETFDAELKRLGIRERPNMLKNSTSNATVHFLTHADGKTHCAIVCLPKWDKFTPAQIAGLLVHEASHIFDKHCDIIGEYEPSSEFKAYALQLITQELMLSFLQQSMPPKKKRK